MPDDKKPREPELTDKAFQGLWLLLAHTIDSIGHIETGTPMHAAGEWLSQMNQYRKATKGGRK